MNRETSISVQHKNCLTTYLGEWMMMVKMLNNKIPHRYDLNRVPTTFESLSNNTHDLSVVLAHLHSRLLILEEKPLSELDSLAYSEARVFLKAFFVFFRILLDNVSGVIEFLYNKNQRGEAVTSSFNDLLRNAKGNKLPNDLNNLIAQTESWFSEVTDVRDDLVHHYDSFLISIDEVEGGNNILGIFNVKGRTSHSNISIRMFLGNFLSQYQTFIDNLLSHFDEKFKDWHKIQPNKSLRNLTIMQGNTAMPLYWAYKYGNYKNPDLSIDESA
jgi:hypothetical protein